MWDELRRRFPHSRIGRLVLVAALVVAVAVVVLGVRHRTGPAHGADPTAEFVPMSVSSPATGGLWVLGTGTHCAAGTSCRQLEHTVDDGHSWQIAAAPATATGVLFVDADNGWAVGDDAVWTTNDGAASWHSRQLPDVHGNAPNYVFATGRDGWAATRSGLWSTHDGGASWQQARVGGAPIPGGSMAVDGGLVRVASAVDAEVRVATSPVGSDDWTIADLGRHAPAGGPVEPELYTAGRAAWVVIQGRTTIGGMRLAADGWRPWELPPCGGNGVGEAQPLSATTIRVLCGRIGPAENGPGVRLFTSGDAGASFTETGDLWSEDTSTSLCGGAQSDRLVAELSERLQDSTQRGRLLTSADGGAHWTTTWKTAARASIQQCGSLSAATAYAVEGDGVHGLLLLSHDGGATWAPVSFGR
jgi:hypothetical protein